MPNHPEMEKTPRREFLKKITIWTALAAGALAALSLLRQFLPRLTHYHQRFKIAEGNQYPLNTFTYIAERKIFVYRDHEGIRAISAVCTHLGCIIEKSEEGFRCPCHGSRFNELGEVLSGAATKDLPWFSLRKAMDGRIIVDQSITAGPEEKLYL